MKLNGSQLQQIQDALLSAFPSKSALSMMTRIELETPLDEVAGGGNLRVIVFNLLTWAESTDRVRDLIDGAQRQNPGNPELARLAGDAQRWPNLPPSAASSKPPTVKLAPATVDIFLSYSRNDSSAMRQVQEALHEAGLSVWTDEGLEPGTQSWNDAIEEALDQAKAVVVLLSPDAKASPWVDNEVIYAQNLNKRIFPVLVDGTEGTAVPINLVSVQWVDGRQNLVEVVEQKLTPAILSLLDAATPPDAAGKGAVIGDQGEGAPPPRSAAPPPDAAGKDAAAAQRATVAEARPGPVSPRVRSRLTGLWPSAAAATLVVLLLVGGWAALRAIGYQIGVVPSAPSDAGGDQVATAATPPIPFTTTPASEPTASEAPQPADPAPAAAATHAPQPPPTATQALAETPAPAADTVRELGGIPFVYVPAGEFTMGSSDAEVDRALELCRTVRSDCSRTEFAHEQLQHTVYLDGYWIMQTEATNALWQRFMDAGGYTTQTHWSESGWEWRAENGITQPDCWEDASLNAPEQPVVCVSWYEVEAFANWLSGESGMTMRLPSEAEWEKAARGTARLSSPQSDGRLFPWGDEWDPSRLNYCDRSCEVYWKDESGDDGYARTAPVGSFPGGASPYGALDMAGNVWEWTSSLYASYPYDPTDGRENQEAPVVAARALHGGSWYYHPHDARGAARYRFSMVDRDWSVGFRLASPGS